MNDNLKKNLANILSAIRIIAGACLYLFSDITGSFIAIYVVCGVTDLLDGPVARKFESTSAVGAILDTVGDIVTYMALVKILLVKHMIPSWIVYWMLGILGLHIIAGFVSLKKTKKFYVVHSLFGKIFGGSIFVLPFAMWIVSKTGLDYMSTVHLLMFIIGCFATLAGIESFAIQCKIDDPETQVKTIYGLIKNNR